MEIKCGFDKTRALVGAGAAAERLNEMFNDSIDPEFVVRAVGHFFKQGADLKCRTCGWVKDGKCTQRGHAMVAGESCGDYRYEIVVKDE